MKMYGAVMRHSVEKNTATSNQQDKAQSLQKVDI